MKKLNLKKLLSLTAAVALTLSLAACSGGTASSPSPSASAPAGSAPAAGEGYKVAVVKQLDHASMDEIANAITGRLDEIAAEKGAEITYQVFSGQNDQSTLTQIGSQIVADGYSAIVPIGTLAAQVMVVAAEDSKTPVIFAAVSDPAYNDLTGIDYLTGTSDALNTEFILDMMLAQNPDTAKVGLLYSKSETNSATPIAEAKTYLDGKGIAYVEATANTNDEVIAAASSLIADGVDAVFTPTDNVVMAAELAIYEDLAAAGIPHYTGADSFVRNGAFATCGVNYTDLGAQTADLVEQALSAGMDGLEDFYKVSGGIITVNTETAAALGADYSVFADMGDLVEVTTTAE
ncbi:MAG: ABC transporter substrate-binding protein [Clostridiales bacterium]|uniref:ABC transporter substrate-binding protein n=1 Tax=Intestinimonas massiliensis (ex Afouda et al. 2020) TaxID=1673721 RepID=A0ABS9M9U5_9FIRM|nr:ABC transporter substrate-binding protein [Intestinimonas massiliensis (ex Afouda et al. 2020)]MCG4527582.1 ABC transporter substrate-binding protein [Intestinimonas massiliensis (ex Afouda et al. 2020)]MCQ4807566.1 ABC transporter substrate-binding protein [Intestinimonas massiliensis (ex Afouda et al. 2020)]MDU1326096.1 ABC transporter substrate-binding protein [Clostridiales bacterium]